MKYLLLPFFIFCVEFASAQYTVGTENISWTDPARSNRNVTLEIRYPGTNTAVATGQFPFVIFAHGFQMDQVPYYPYSDSLVKRGYIVGLLTTETSLSPSHANFAQDLIFAYNKLISEGSTNAASPFYQKVIAKGAMGGHSMGGGSTVLSAQYANPANCYFTFAAANTNPSSIAAAKSMTKPYLAFAGSRDCVAPPAAHQIPMYDSSASPCKVYVNITDGRHCAFGSSNFQCNFGEGFSGCASSPLSTTDQINKSLLYLIPYLDYYLKGDCSAWTLFETRYSANTVDSLRRNCTNNVPANAAITGNTQFCAGNTTTLAAQPNGFSYVWSDNSTANTLVVTQAGSYSVTVGNGVCSLPAVSLNVTQATAPGTPSTIQVSDTVCSGIANVVVEVAEDSTVFYNWSLPSGWNVTQGDSTNAIVVTSGNTGGAISVTAENYCGVSTAVQKSVVVVPSNLGNTGAITGNDSVCAGEVLVYSIQPVSGADSYLWTLPTGWSFTASTDTTTVEVNAAGNSGIVTVMAMNSCGASPASTLTVAASAIPVLTGSIMGLDTVCLGSGQGVYYAVDSPVNASYVWTIPNDWSFFGSGNGGNSMSTIINVNSTGSVSVIAENECGQSAPLTYNVAVVDTPMPQVTQTGFNVSTVKGMLISTSADSYQWYRNGALIPGATQEAYDSAAPFAYYSVRVTDANGCSGESNRIWVNYESVTEAEEQYLTVYPNPASNRIFISKPFAGSLSVQLFTTEGKLIHAQSLTDASQSVDVSRLAKGMYVLHVAVDDKVLRKKVAVE